MATISRKQNADRTVRYVAQVRIRPFKPIARSFETRKEAKAWAVETEASLRENRHAGKQRPDLAGLTLAGLNAQYLADDAATSLRSFQSTCDRLAWWTLHFGKEPVLEINPLLLRAARDKLRPGRAPATVNRYVSAQRSAWNWGRAAGLIPANRPWPTRLMLREPKGRVRFLSDTELQALLKSARDHGAVAHALVTLALATGARRGELARLRWSDVDLGSKPHVRIVQAKNDCARVLHLPASAVAALKRLRLAGVVGKVLFVDPSAQPMTTNALSNVWERVRASAGLNDFRFHDLRHTTASYLAQNGASLLEIAEVLGHKSLQVTQRYAHLRPGEQVTGHAALDAKIRGAETRT